MNGTSNNTSGDVNGGSPVRNGNETNHASSSLMEPVDMDGRDNPAFETDDPGGSPTKKSVEVKGQPANAMVNNGDVEMVPLNPNSGGPQHQTNNGNGTTTTTNNKDQKVVLDTMYSDYFRPVNTRRKLLRGEKLYVTRDQRAHSRGWKWIAFWGGVFTFVAAALLTGILAATGIIMSQSEPTFGSSHSTLVGNGNHSFENDTDIHDNNFYPNSNRDEVTTTEHLTTTSSTESTNIPVQVDFGNSLDDNSWTTTTTEGQHQQHHPPTDQVIDWLNHLNITGNDLGVDATTTTTTKRSTEGVVAVSESEPTDNLDGAVASIDNITNTINDRGRSLDEEVTVVPMEEETTLFPTLKSIDEFDLEDADSLPTTTNETETLTSSQATLFDDGLDLPFWNSTDNVTDVVLNSEDEGSRESSTEGNMFLGPTTIEHKDHPANETVEETTNSTSIDGRNALSSHDNETEFHNITEEVNTTTGFDVSSDLTTIVLPSTEATTMTTTTVSVHDTTWTQVSNLSLTPSDSEIEDLFNETTIPHNLSVNATSEAGFNETITARNTNDTLLVATDNPEEEKLVKNSTKLSSLVTTNELSSNTTVNVTEATNETDITTTTAVTPTTIVISEAMHNTTNEELLDETTPSSIETTEKLWTSEVESWNATDNSTAMVTENATTSLVEEESDDMNLAEV